MALADYEVVIGLEVHCQLATRTKMFSPCPYTIGSAPNTEIDAYTLGLPGTLPVPNRAAIEAAVRLALALGCEVQPRSSWARKHYFYPDLPKGYQITQADAPYAKGGHVEIHDRGAEAPTNEGEGEGEALASKRIPLQRIHIEEDAGKNVHGGELSLIDYNRAGVPLVEIVSLPALRSAAEAADYMRALREVVRYLGISAANMEEGSLRCDANVSLRERGASEYGIRCEIKNLNSFKFLEAAILAEVRRQADLLDRGERIVSATLSYDPERDRVSIMRSKESAADYRYLPEPDMPPLLLDGEWIAAIEHTLPALPWARRRRLVGLGLSAYDAGVLTAERELADYFDQTLAALTGADAEPSPAAAKTVSNWITGELMRLLNASEVEIAACPVAPATLAELLGLVDDGTISGSAAKKVLERVFAEPSRAPLEVVEAEGLRQVSDRAAIVALVDAALDAHPKQLAQLLGGKHKVRGFFVGQVMRASQGKANPQLVSALLDERLAERRDSTDPPGDDHA